MPWWVPMAFIPSCVTSSSVPMNRFRRGASLTALFFPPLCSTVWRLVLLEPSGGAPPTVTPSPVAPDESNLLAGAKVYKEQCASCHGLPDQPPPAISEGMYPHSPLLFKGPFIGTYLRTFKKTDIRGARLTSRRDRGHIISQDPERNFALNATVSPVDLKFSIVSQKWLLVERTDISISQSATCARCNKEDCAAVVIIPAVRDNLRRVEYAKQHFELICPACHRFFSVAFRNGEYRDVTDELLRWGFIDGRLVHKAGSRTVQMTSRGRFLRVLINAG
jgi:hypothetical protein